MRKKRNHYKKFKIKRTILICRNKRNITYPYSTTKNCCNLRNIYVFFIDNKGKTFLPRKNHKNSSFNKFKTTVYYQFNNINLYFEYRQN